MARTYPDALALSWRLLRLLIALNLGVGVLILIGLAVSLAAPAFVFSALGADPSASGQTMGLRGIAVIGLLAVPLTHVMLTRLRAIVDTVREGDPFVAENARRLQLIAWTVLGLEVLHLFVGLVAAAGSSDDAPIHVGWGFSFTRWLAVLLLFVLARVFAHGAQMRDELEGTV